MLTNKTMIQRSNTLEQLRDNLQMIELIRDDCAENNTPLDEVDYTDLPTFGGDEPADTSGVWSWNEQSLLVGSCLDDFEIIDR